MQVLSQYNNLKKGGFESVHEFSSRFTWVYNSIPADIKPSLGVAKLHYTNAFNNYFALLLRERKSNTLSAMFTYTLEVEANMMAYGKIKPRAEVDTRKGREEAHPTTSASSSNDIKFEMMLKTMEKLMDRLIVEANMMACGKIKPRAEINGRKGREESHPSTSASSSSDIKFKMILKTMEKLMDMLMVEAKLANREQNEPQIRNTNFRRQVPSPLTK